MEEEEDRQGGVRGERGRRMEGWGDGMMEEEKDTDNGEKGEGRQK